MSNFVLLSSYPSEVIERENKIGSVQGQPKLLTFQDRHVHEKSDPDPYFQPLDHEIEGVVYDEHIKDNNAEDNEDINANFSDQGGEEQDASINEVDDPPENENEVPTLADESEIEGLPDALAAQAVPETLEEPKLRSGRITAPVTRLNRPLPARNTQRQLQQQYKNQQSTQTLI